ncbi:MAG: iron export ABC transporter permease subunit FetB, partial [Eubacteriales bacterium]
HKPQQGTGFKVFRKHTGYRKAGDIMKGAADIGILSFCLVYVLLLIVLILMKRARIGKTRILLIAGLRMTVQLVLVGFVLTFIFQNPNPLFTVVFLAAMIIFSIHRVLSKQKKLNRQFKIIVGASLAFSGLAVTAYFVCVITGQNFFNPQYTIPLAGMIMGNAMTGVNLGLSNFMENLKLQKQKMDTLLNLGVHPRDILRPIAGSALETALIPTINSMLGMGIIFLPGMMTGQILSGTLPTTAILYQIAIMIAICASVCLSVFFALHLGYKTLFNSKSQFTNL